MLFDDPAAVGNLISGSSAFSKSSLNIWKFIAHVLLKPGLENFEHYLSREFLIQYDLIQYESSSSFKKKRDREHAEGRGGAADDYRYISSVRKGQVLP